MRFETTYLDDVDGDPEERVAVLARRITAFPGLALADTEEDPEPFDAADPVRRLEQVLDNHPDLVDACLEQVGGALGGLTPAAIELARLDQAAWNLWRGRPRAMMRQFYLLAAIRRPGEPAQEMLSRLAADVPHTPALKEKAAEYHMVVEALRSRR